MMTSGRPDFWLSIFVIGVMIVMGAYMVVFILRQVSKDAAAAEAAANGDADSSKATTDNGK